MDFFTILDFFDQNHRSNMGLGPSTDPFNSIDFCIEINKCIQFLTPKSFWVKKLLTFLKLLKKIFLIFSQRPKKKLFGR